MHNISVVFGLIAFVIIGKGLMDMHRALNDTPFFDRIYTTESDTLQVRTDACRLTVFPYSELKHRVNPGGWYVTRGGVWFDCRDSMELVTPGGTLYIAHGSGYVLSDRYPEIFLLQGELHIGDNILKGKRLYYRDYGKRIDTLDTPLPAPPYIIIPQGKTPDILRRFFPDFRQGDSFPLPRVEIRLH
ncbi:MAG: hypothetical protein GXO27_01890 [Chlorobi bacterium]|nr:hypothetical protein [Chlorobiota bacterium]